MHMLVPEVGIEPTRPEGHRILSPARLPIPPLRRPAQSIVGLVSRLVKMVMWITAYQTATLSLSSIY